MQLKPSIPTVDDVIANAKHSYTIIINGTSYVARDRNGTEKAPYYSNFVKRIIAAFMVLSGKGLVIRFSEDQIKQDEIKSLSFK